MADEGKSADIEDVLSSVRLLVSEDSRAPAATPLNAPQAPVPDNRLVLTDAFRISTTDAAPASPSPALETIAEAPAPQAPTPPLTEPTEPSVSDNASASQDPYQKTPGEDIENDVIIAEDFVIGESVDVADPEDPMAMASLEETIAGLEFVISQQGISFEPDGSEVAADPSPAYQELERRIQDDPEIRQPPVEDVAPDLPMPVETHADPVLSDETDQPVPDVEKEAAGGEWAGWVDPASDLNVPSALVVEEEDDINDDAQQAVLDVPEPAVEVPMEEPADAEVHEDVSLDDTPEVIPEAAQEDPIVRSSQDDPADDTEDLLETEVLADEDALRDIVSTLVRQELQGELGERITRSVRKLVRREIQRALAAQDLE